MKLLIDLLLAFFRPGIDVDPDEKVDVDKAVADADPAEDLEADIDTDAPDKTDADERPSAAEFAAAQAAVRAEKERGDRFEREMGELRARSQPAADEITRQEDARLKDEKTSDLEKWQIQANRELRQGRSEAQMALAQAHDVGDKTAFSALAIKEPALFKRYESRVEEELATARKAGYNPKREVIMNLLIGRDMRDGKFKKKAAPAEKTDEGKTTVARGKLPGARSDVKGKTSMTEREKRAARLEGVQI